MEWILEPLNLKAELFGSANIDDNCNDKPCPCFGPSYCPYFGSCAPKPCGNPGLVAVYY